VDYIIVMASDAEATPVMEVLLQPLGWRSVECAIHHERDVRKE